MTYPRHLFRHPGPYGSGDTSYEVAGAADEEQEALLVSQGWHASKEAAWGFSALDHDGDGKPGGSTKPTGDLKSLRDEYRELAGKKPFPGWGEELLREKIAALKED